MFTQPSVNQIASTYQGNPAPLAQKVDQDKKQHGGIPQDLRQLLALNDITEMREGAGIQSALNAPADMPTVAQNIQQQAKQALQAKMVQEAQQRMAKEGQMGIPQGVPQPNPQPRGIDTLPANVGQSYFNGGVVSFDEGGAMPPDTRSADDILREQMRVNEEDKRTQEIARRDREVGKQDTTQIDRLIAELEGRKTKLEPAKSGYDATMEYLAQIANTPRGISSAEAGSRGAAQLKALQLARAEQQNALTEKGIELAQKKLDQGYQYKSDQYNVGKTAAADAIKQRYDAAIAVADNDQKKAKLAQDRDLELRKLALEGQRISAMKVNPALQIADALQGASPERLNAIKEGIAGVYGNRSGQTDAALLRDYETSIKNTNERFLEKDDRRYKKAEKQAWKEDYDKAIEGVNKNYAQYGIGPLASRGLPSAVPPPSATPSAPPTAGGYTAMVNGRVFNFPTQAAADAFKQASGAK